MFVVSGKEGREGENVRKKERNSGKSGGNADRVKNFKHFLYYWYRFGFGALRLRRMTVMLASISGRHIARLPRKRVQISDSCFQIIY